MAESLNWEYIDGRGGEMGFQRATYRGLIIEAHPDQSPGNPFEEYDGEPPLVARFDRDLSDYSKGEIFAPLAGVSDAWINRKWRAVSDAIGGQDADSFDAECRADAKADRMPLADVRREALERALSEALPGRDGYGFDASREILAALWQLRGCETLTATSRGYVQSAWADLLLVATPAWAERTGAPRASHRANLEGARDLFNAWAWGDVYGYVVKSPAGEHLDSCWGYYGSDHGDSGLEEAATESADWIVQDAAKRRADTLRALIHNHVPLDKRPALLAAAGAPHATH